MRDLLEEIGGSSGATSVKTGGRDLLAELGGGVSRSKPVPYTPSFIDNLLKGGGAELETLGDPSNPEAAGVIAATGGSLLAMPVAGIAGLSKTITSGLGEGQKTLEAVGGIPGRLLKTEGQQRAAGEIGKLMIPFQMAGEGLQEIVRQTPLKGTIAEPIAGTIGEASAMFGLPGIPKGFRNFVNRMPYRKRVMVVDQIKADIESGNLSTAEIRELWKDTANRDALRARYQGVGNEQRPGPTVRGSGSEATGELPPGQGFELRPRPGEVRDILAELGAEGPKRLPPGQGFELRPRPDEVRDILAEMGQTPPLLEMPKGVGDEFTFADTSVESPIVTKAGEPFKSEKSAAQAGKGLDWNLYEVTPQGEGFAITRKAGQEFRPQGAAGITPVIETPLQAGTPTPEIKIAQTGATSGGKQPWEMTRDEWKNETKELYHGTRGENGFLEFDIEKSQSKPFYAWLAEDIDYASDYGDVGKYRIYTKKPLDITKETMFAPGEGVKELPVEKWVKIFNKKGLNIKLTDPDFEGVKVALWDLLDGSDIDATKATNLKEALTQSKYDSLINIEANRYGDPYVAHGLLKQGMEKTHENIIKQALSEGKPVPPEVLKDYPELAKKDIPARIETLGKKKATAKGPEGINEKLFNERGSTGDLSESEVLKAILSARGKIEEAMPHLETLGRSVYEGGKGKFLDWQAGMKTKLGDLWESFRGAMRDVWNRLSSERGSIGGELKNKAKEEVKDVLSETRKTADEYMGAISTRLGNIHPGIRNTLRTFEFRRGMKATAAVKRVLPFIEKVGKMDKVDKAAFDIARKNGDPATLKALVIKYGLGKEYHELRKVLQETRQEALDVGYDVGLLPNYHPRVLKDTKGFLEYFYKQNDWPVIEKAIRAKETELQRYLSDEEKAKVINTMLRGYPSGQISLSKTGQMKAREITTVTPELNKFYMDSDGALLRYINDVTDAVEARKLFGKTAKGGKVGNIEDTIGGYVLKLLQEGKIKPEQERVLRDILDARFNEVGTRGIFGLYKNMSYIDTMGSPISAITQIGDLAWALYKNGLGKTMEATGKATLGKSLFKKEDIGIERIASEFADSSKLARAVDTTFRMIGLTKIDNIGKESLINSSYAKARQQAMTDRGTAALRKELGPIFEGETDQLIKDLRTGNITDNVKLYLFNVLSDFQPISLSEMPQKYLTGGNGRIFYMLKTFTLKQFDTFRREAFQKIGTSGQRTQGLKNLVRLAACFAAANATSDVIKDLILGRPIDVGDKVVDNMLRLVGISKFVTWKAREEGAGSAMVRQIMPPFKLADALTKDIIKGGDGKGLETMQSIPIVGKLYYWWFGKGAEKSEKKAISQGKLTQPKTLKGNLKGLN